MNLRLYLKFMPLDNPIDCPFLIRARVNEKMFSFLNINNMIFIWSMNERKE